MACPRIGGSLLLVVCFALGCQSSPQEQGAPQEQAARPHGGEAQAPIGQDQAPAETQTDGRPQIDPAVQREARQKLEAAGIAVSTAALRAAARQGNLEHAQLLINAGVDLNEQDEDRWSALFFAAEGGRTGLVKALMVAGASTTLQDRRGNTALHWAAGEGHLETVVAMIEAGVEVDPENTSGYTPMLSAWHYQRQAVVDYLIAHGAEDRRRQD